jgi:ribosomal 50S subunit-recycling heat shock protein
MQTNRTSTTEIENISETKNLHLSNNMSAVRRANNNVGNVGNVARNYEKGLKTSCRGKRSQPSAQVSRQDVICVGINNKLTTGEQIKMQTRFLAKTDVQKYETELTKYKPNIARTIYHYTQCIGLTTTNTYLFLAKTCL